MGKKKGWDFRKMLKKFDLGRNVLRAFFVLFCFFVFFFFFFWYHIARMFGKKLSSSKQKRSCIGT